MSTTICTVVLLSDSGELVASSDPISSANAVEAVRDIWVEYITTDHEVHVREWDSDGNYTTIYKEKCRGRTTPKTDDRH